MRWLKRGLCKVGITVAGMLLLLVLMVWVPRSVVGAYKGALGLATPVMGTVQITPTVDPTMTALQKEQLTQQVRQLDNWWLYWLYNGSTALIAAITAIVVASIGFTQWAGNVRQAKDKDLKDREEERRKEVEVQNKDLKAQAEERFKTAVAALGDEKEGVQLGGAILLRSFLNKDDKEIYGRYYTQIFDLAVAYLRLPRTSNPPEDPDGIPHSPEGPNAPLPLTTLRQALIVVFKEAFPLAQSQNKGGPQSLDATYIQLDNAYLAGADLKHAWMPQASLRETNLTKANLLEADLSGANLTKAYLSGAYLSGAYLSGADLLAANIHGAYLHEAKLSGAKLSADLSRASLLGADLSVADLSVADLSGATLMKADLSVADLSVADLSGAYLYGIRNLEDALSLKDTDLRRVKGLTKEQLEACKAKGAIIDEDPVTSSPQPTVAPPSPSQSNDAQALSAPPAQVSTSTLDRRGSTATTSPQQGSES
jgi:uncharacterized protein YjbI with pentapeptide repeats